MPDAEPPLDERVLILTTPGRNAVVAAMMVRHGGVRAHICRSDLELERESEAGAGAILLAEEALGPAMLSRLSAVLAQQPSWSDLPIVVLIDEDEGEVPHSTVATLAKLAPLGNVTVLERPIRVMALLSAIRTALRGRRRQYDVRDRLAEQRRSEEERERLLAGEQAARADVEAATRAKDDFLAVLSHELRTPLQSMLGWVKVLRSGHLDSRAAARALETIERNTRAQAQLIEDLLDVSRIVAGKLRVDLRPVTFVPVVEAAIEAVRGAASSKNIRIDADFESRQVQVSGDPDRLQQVAWNLLSNAVKFTPEGGRIDVRLRRTESQVVLSISDTGRGIPGEVLPTIFQRFRQADSTTTRAFGGLGLGLAIVRHLVELHGGEVEAESPGEGHGAVFTVTLGLLSADGGAFEPVSLAERLRHGPPPTGALLQDVRLLVVDDDEGTRDVLTTVLENVGAQVTSAASVTEALGTLHWLRPDVIVSDISMPGEDGYTLVRRLRALEGGRRDRTIRALALTAHARPEDSEQALEAGFDTHLAKPVDPTQLALEIARLVGRAQDGGPRSSATAA